MTLKRRRERDRPKSGPEEVYDPNKRVLLSYASDADEDVEGAAEQPGHFATNNQGLADYQLDELPEGEDDVQAGAEQPSTTVKEKEASEKTKPQNDAGGKSKTNRQTQQSHPSSKWGNHVRRNEKTNQYPQLGLVSYQWDEEDENEDYDSTTEEAMAYLRAVRSERQELPEILTAPARDQNPEDYAPQPAGTGEDDGDHDGVWVAPASSTAAKEDEQAPQTVYTRNIKERFLDQRRQLRLPPTAQALADLDDSYPISFPQGSNKAFADWHRLLSTKPPRLAQLQSLEQETVFDLLKLLRTRILAPGGKIEKHVSNWVWSLLARLDDVDNMTNDEVYPLRELGKRAVFLQYSITSPEVAAQLEDLGQSGSSNVNEDQIPRDDVEDDDEAQKQHPGPSSPHNDQNAATAVPDAMDNTLATLDMILVVVGEVYRQRDLLEFRTPWQATEAKPS